jgi:hypothetical protein
VTYCNSETTSRWPIQAPIRKYTVFKIKLNFSMVIKMFKHTHICTHKKYLPNIHMCIKHACQKQCKSCCRTYVDNTGNRTVDSRGVNLASIIRLACTYMVRCAGMYGKWLRQSNPFVGLSSFILSTYVCTIGYEPFRLHWTTNCRLKDSLTKLVRQLARQSLFDG